MTLAAEPPKTDCGPPDPTERVAAVGHQLNALERALRAMMLYSVNNPLYRATIDQLQIGFRGFWQLETRLRLHITSAGFEWNGHVVQHNAEHPEGAWWLLYRGGVRSLTLTPGSEGTELIHFLELIKRSGVNVPQQHHPPAAHHSQDEYPVQHDELLTLLWSEDFPHIRYEYEECQGDELGELRPSRSLPSLGSPQAVESMIRADVAAAEDSDQRTHVRSNDDECAAYVLDDTDIERVRREIDDESRVETIAVAHGILFDIFETQGDGRPQDEVAAIIEGLVDKHLLTGDFGLAVSILREARDVVMRASAENDAIRKLDALPARISTPEFVDGLMQNLDDSVAAPPREDLSELFSHLRPHAIGVIVSWIPKFRHSSVKGTVSLALAPIARRNPSHLICSLASQQPDALVSALGLIESLGLRTVSADVVRFATHEDARVRKAAAATLAALANNEALTALTQMILDPDREVRMKAAECLGRSKYFGALELVESILETELRNASLSEKRVFFSAFAALAGEAGVDRLNAVLNSRRFLRRRGDPETRACAAMALGLIGSPAALEALNCALRDRETIVRNAAEKALQEKR